MIHTSIKTTEEFSSKLRGGIRRDANQRSFFADAAAFVFNQVEAHGNGTPATALRNALPVMGCRPKGLTVKNLDAFIERYTGLSWDMTDKVYNKNKGSSDLQALPVDHCRFWEYESEEDAPTFTDTEKLRNYLVKRSGKLSIDEVLVIVSEVYEVKKVA